MWNMWCELLWRTFREPDLVAVLNSVVTSMTVCDEKMTFTLLCNSLLMVLSAAQKEQRLKALASQTKENVAPSFNCASDCGSADGDSDVEPAHASSEMQRTGSFKSMLEGKLNQARLV